MYAGDHPPPHTHILMRDGRECLVYLDDLVVTGRVSAREIQNELQWISLHRRQLYETWRRLNP